MAEDDPPEVLAGEYVLGVLDAEERTAFELRMVREPALAQLVQDWQARLLPLDEELAPITPSPEVWRRNGRTIRTQQSRPRTAWWNRLGLWCGWAVAVTASAFGLLVPLAVERVPTPQLVAVLNDSNGHPLWVVNAGSDTGLLAPPLGSPDEQARVPELWLLPRDGRPQCRLVSSSSRAIIGACLPRRSRRCLHRAPTWLLVLNRWEDRLRASQPVP